MKQRVRHGLRILMFLLIANGLHGQVVDTIGKSNLDSLAKALNNKGVDFAEADDFERAGIYFEKSLRVKERIPNYSKSKLAIGYLNLANIKQQLKSVNTALTYYQKAEGLIKQVDKPSNVILGTIYVEMGYCYIRLYDLQTAIPMIKRGVELIESDSIPDYNKLILAKIKLAFAQCAADLPSEAVIIGNKMLTLASKHQPKLLYAVHNSLGNSYLDSKDYRKALHHFKESVKALDTRNDFNSIKLVRLYTNIGFSYQSLLLHNEAENYYNKALALSKKYNLIPKICLIYNNLGVLRLDQGLLGQAEALLLASIASNTIDTAKTNVAASPNSFFSLSRAVYSFQNLGNVYAKQHQRGKDFGKALESIRAYRKAILIADDIRFWLDSENDKLLVAEKYNNLYDDAIESAYEFSTINSAYLDEAYRLISKGKAAILHELILKDKGNSISGIPTQLQQQEVLVKTRFEYLSEKLYEAQRATSMGSTQIKSLEEQLFKVQSEYHSILKTIKADYPNYYGLRYDTSSISISGIQALLPDNKLVIDYYKTDSTIYSFAIGKGVVKHSSQHLDKEFYTNLSEFREELVPNDFYSISTDNVQRFANASFYLYTMLLKPYERELKGKEITIIPHNELISIPFAALITAKPVNPRDFYSLPYLVKTNPISYSLSSKLFVDQLAAPQILFPRSLSVAPLYTENAKRNISQTATYRDVLSDLPGARDETRSIRRIFHGSILLDGNATEKEFKAIAGDYDIIHLAMHTFIDDKNPNFSKFIFAPSTDSLNDGYLNAYEVYNLKLKSRLAILSTCRSGDGNLIKGEGILSLARGFFYAGCPSLVTTQWRVDDGAGSKLMVNFAKLIKKGRALSISLQTAQKNFIAKEDPLRSHPYFWAAYQVIGSDSPISFKGLSYIYIAILPTIIILAGLAAYYKIRR